MKVHKTTSGFHKTRVPPALERR